MLILSALFLFTDTATTEIYTLSLHDALPISSVSSSARASRAERATSNPQGANSSTSGSAARTASMSTCTECAPGRSEEHTSELQSRLHLVCRLLLEKKNKHQIRYERAVAPHE